MFTIFKKNISHLIQKQFHENRMVAMTTTTGENISPSLVEFLSQFWCLLGHSQATVYFWRAGRKSLISKSITLFIKYNKNVIIDRYSIAQSRDRRRGTTRL